MNEIAKVLEKFKEKNILLLGHKNADPDSVCSIIALSLGLEKAGFKVRRGAVEDISKISCKILAELGEQIEINPKLDADLIIMLDLSTEGQLASFAPLIASSKAKKMILDHHTIQDCTLKADFSFIDEKASSTVELAYDLLRELQIGIDEKIAKAILLGIVAETAHLQFASIKNFKILSELMEKFSINYRWLVATLEAPLDVSERIARLKASQRVKFERFGNYLVATSKVTSFEASAARALIRAGADLAAVAAEKEGEVRISLRSTMRFCEKTKIDLGKDVIPKVSAIIGGTGSGHPTAAGANGKLVKKADEALNYVVKFVKERVK